ncbi:MAG: hypothetical protein JW821_19250 [Deltaproteobacteria bacterium]|nr:hypothetical protein [Deltaproteobacteria bacterium]
MKKHILSPLCSAFVIPGLGQILNGDLKKGLAILAVVFLLFIAATVKFVFIVSSLFRSPEGLPSGSGEVMERIQGQDLSILVLLLAAFGIVWLYSVIDSFREGLRQERIAAGDGPCDPM